MPPGRHPIPRQGRGDSLVMFGICNMERYALSLPKTRKIACFCGRAALPNPLNKRLRVDKSLGFVSGEVVFEKEGSGKDPRLAERHHFIRRGINRRFERCYEIRT